MDTQEQIKQLASIFLQYLLATEIENRGGSCYSVENGEVPAIRKVTLLADGLGKMVPLLTTRNSKDQYREPNVTEREPITELSRSL